VSARLESRLAALRDELEWPPTPDLAAAMAERVAAEEGGAGGAASRRDRFARLRRPFAAGFGPALAAVLAALLVAIGIAAAVSSDVRAALRDLLGISGAVRIERVDRLPDLPAARGLELGARTTPAAVARRSAFPIRRPRTLRAPDGVYRTARGIVSLVYLDRGGAIRILLMALPGRGDIGFSKLVQGGVGVDLVRVGGARGYWINGPHALLYADRTGDVREERPRLAGRTLVWTTRDGVTYRLESRLTKNAALRIAGSVR
jgi:hypothetical protein